jgi:hypothetical protein
MKTDEQQIRAWLDNIPTTYRGKFRRDWLTAMTTRKLKKAIAAKCQDCCNWQSPEVRDCSIITCPLWPHRTHKSNAIRIEQVKRVAEGLFDEYAPELPSEGGPGAENGSEDAM